MAEQTELYRAHLAIAVFCEKVLREADNVVSIIRIIDRFNIQCITPELQTQTFPCTIFISFKSGFLRGKQIISIRPKSPDGMDMPSMHIPVLFEGDAERNNHLIASINLTIEHEGLYWFDIHLNEELITRMPLRIAYQQGMLPIAG